MDQNKRQNKTYKKGRKMLLAGRREYKEAVRLFTKMLVALFLCEAAVMILLYFVPLERDMCNLRGFK